VNVFANWLDPADADAQQNRAKAEKLFSKLSAASYEPARRVMELQDKLQAPLGQGVTWIGVLHRNPSGTWTMAAGSSVTGSGKLIVVLQPVGDGPIRMEPIGSLINSQVKVANASRVVGVEGRPVFFQADK
jgi:hypothetical protein